MILTKKPLMDYLIARAQEEDPEASSHWRHYHREFSIDSNGTVSGI